ncbi:hypothetical protein J6590_039974 [Homalodisca vitripennis]|nr:hypothetical protein J6590_039974 [Homalodisca vitripennis]
MAEWRGTVRAAVPYRGDKKNKKGGRPGHVRTCETLTGPNESLTIILQRSTWKCLHKNVAVSLEPLGGEWPPGSRHSTPLLVGGSGSDPTF